MHFPILNFAAAYLPQLKYLLNTYDVFFAVVKKRIDYTEAMIPATSNFHLV